MIEPGSDLEQKNACQQIASYNANVHRTQKILQKSVYHAALLHDYISKDTHTLLLQVHLNRTLRQIKEYCESSSPD